MKTSTIVWVAGISILVLFTALAEAASYRGASEAHGDSPGLSGADGKRLDPAVDASGVESAMPGAAEALLEAAMETDEGVRSFDAGCYDEAEAAFKKALEIRQTVFGKRHIEVTKSLSDLAGLYRAMGRYGQAEPLMELAGDIREKKLSRNSLDLAANFYDLARLYDVEGRHRNAEMFYKRALAIWEARFGPHHPDLIVRFNCLAALYESMHRHDEAEPLLARALGICEVKYGRDDSHLAPSLNNLAVLYFRIGRYGKAMRLYKRALSVAQGAPNPEILRCVEGNYSVLLVRLDRPDGAVFFQKLAADSEPAAASRTNTPLQSAAPGASAAESEKETPPRSHSGGAAPGLPAPENDACLVLDFFRQATAAPGARALESERSSFKVFHVSEEALHKSLARPPEKAQSEARKAKELEIREEYATAAQSLARLREERAPLLDHKERTPAEDAQLARFGKDLGKAEEAFQEVVDAISGKPSGRDLQPVAHPHGRVP